MKCKAGFLCFAGSRTSMPTNVARDNGRLCKRGYYCIKGALSDEICPIGTFNPDFG